MDLKTFESFSPKTGKIKSDKLFVIKNYDDTDIHELYFSEKEAQEQCDKDNEALYDMYRKTHKSMTASEFEKYMDDNHKRYKDYVKS
jgi:hypothetical protein